VYAQAVASAIDSSPFNRNKITFDAAGITSELKQQFPEIGRASLTLPLIGHDPVLHIQAIEPKAILLSSSGGMYVIDSNGRAQIDLAHERSRSQIASELAQYDLPTIKDESGLEIETGRVGGRAGASRTPRGQISWHALAAMTNPQCQIPNDKSSIGDLSSVIDLARRTWTVILPGNLAGVERLHSPRSRACHSSTSRETDQCRVSCCGTRWNRCTSSTS
jgi:hypothetical protein